MRLKTESVTGERRGFFSFVSPVGRVRLARFARKTLTPRFTDFFTNFEKKKRLFCSLTNLLKSTEMFTKLLTRAP